MKSSTNSSDYAGIATIVLVKNYSKAIKVGIRYPITQHGC